MAISKSRRFEIFKRDKFTCCYCGKQPPEVTLEIDHVQPRAGGGSDEIVNLVTACQACNNGKAAKSLDEHIPAAFTENELARVQDMLERQHALEVIDEASRQHATWLQERVKRCVHLWDQLWPSCAQGAILQQRQIGTLQHFLTVIGCEDVLQHLTTAANKTRSPYQAWKYFCGICWNIIKRQKEE